MEPDSSLDRPELKTRTGLQPDLRRKSLAMTRHDLIFVDHVAHDSAFSRFGLDLE